MELSNRTSEHENGRELLLSLYEQKKATSSHSKLLELQKQIDVIVANNLLRYITGA